MATEITFPVTVVFAIGPRRVLTCDLEVKLGCTAAMAIELSGLLHPVPQPEIDLLELGVWGRKVSGQHPLRPHDRVELYRPLMVDPKVARRERFAKQGAKSAGLFAQRRTGAKAGY
ncbi:RnfH family protein [Rhodoferax sp.]|uniref:RnfH family protein n=1 Tax=Rhodoferax sp. TaxID=50421 RepID=UPI002ACE62CF|nr:RnfH family protein [Rhodoferax sp.]MDZ7919754.1 RnfH family protein [Rhodoferax sp.]